MAARAGVFFVLLAGVPGHAQTDAVQEGKPNPGAAEGRAADPGAAAPVFGPSARPPQQGSSDKVPSKGVLPDRGTQEPDAGRFGAKNASGPEARPAELCAALSLGATPLPAWQRSALPDESWECFSEQNFGPAEGGGSVFAILRGSAEARVEGLRLKLNLPGEGTGQAAQNAAGKTLEAVFAGLGRVVPPALRSALADRAPFNQEIGGMTMVLRQEFGTVPRYNVIVDFAPSPEAPGKPRMGGDTGGPDQP